MTCSALGIPFIVLHDEDVWPVDDASDEHKQKVENDKADSENLRIAEAVGQAESIYVLRPTLEECLGIGRSARDKPKRVVEAIQALDVAHVPQPLAEAVKALFGFGSESVSGTPGREV